MRDVVVQLIVILDNTFYILRILTTLPALLYLQNLNNKPNCCFFIIGKVNSNIYELKLTPRLIIDASSCDKI